VSFAKNIYHKLLLLPGVPSLFRSAHRNCATVFMLHRFSDGQRGSKGLDPSQLRRELDYLRRNNYKFLSLSRLFERFAEDGPELRGAVVFTIDDGYIDQAEIASPIFAEFDCPVTTFVTTGFLDGKLWMWWDKIEFIFLSTRRMSLEILLGEDAVHYELSNEKNIEAAKEDFVERCKSFEESTKLKTIAHLAEIAEVDLPDIPPVMYAPMTWDDARKCEKKGMTFGPHTVTHPILSCTTSEYAEWEITESWRRVCEEVRSPVPVFCYPNGQWQDFGSRDVEIIRNAGIKGAVVGERGFAASGSFRRDNEGPYRVRRLPFPDTHSDFIQCVSGIERCKQIVRSRL
jgi:peptidoglycan/xylan/chitin deacetylase (PgdA/CDA1 family)